MKHVPFFSVDVFSHEKNQLNMDRKIQLIPEEAQVSVMLLALLIGVKISIDGGGNSVAVIATFEHY